LQLSADEDILQFLSASVPFFVAKVSSKSTWLKDISICNLHKLDIKAHFNHEIGRGFLQSLHRLMPSREYATGASRDKQVSPWNTSQIQQAKHGCYKSKIAKPLVI